MSRFFASLLLIILVSSPAFIARAQEPAGVPAVLSAMQDDDAPLADPQGLRRIYDAHGDRLLWAGGESQARGRAALLALLDESWTEGLNPGTYHVLNLHTLIDGAHDNADELAAFDILLSDAVMRYGHDLTGMRIAAAAQNPSSWRQPEDGARILEEAAHAANPARVLTALAPQDTLYALMRNEMLRLATPTPGSPPAPAAAGRATRDHMRQLVANLERLRWLDPERPGRYVLVNLPSRTLWAVEDNRIVFDMPVVIGRSERPTPTLKTTANGVRFAAGHLRILMPNGYDVDLHDDGLAERNQTYSGLAVPQADDLAAFVLDSRKGWTADRVRQAMASGRTADVMTRQAVPVYIVYQTVWPDGQGGLVYGDDIYGLDRSLLQRLGAAHAYALPGESFDRASR